MQTFPHTDLSVLHEPVNNTLLAIEPKYEGIPPGTRWADIPDDWACPGCGASKTEFAMMEVA